MFDVIYIQIITIINQQVKIDKNDKIKKFLFLFSIDQYNQTDVDSYPSNDFRTNSSLDNGIHYVTLQKLNDNQSFGFVIISSQNKAGATVGK